MKRRLHLLVGVIGALVILMEVNGAFGGSPVTGNVIATVGLLTPLTESAPLSISTWLPDAPWGATYSASIQVTGGTPPYKFTKIGAYSTKFRLTAKRGQLTGITKNVTEGHSTIFRVLVQDSSASPPASKNVTLHLKVAPPTNVQTAYAYFVRTRHLTQAQAAGLIGNLQVESGNYMTPKKRQTRCKGVNCGRGIGQWDQSRWAKLVRLATSEGKTPWTLGVQLDFVWQELSSTTTLFYGKLSNTTPTTGKSFGKSRTGKLVLRWVPIYKKVVNKETGESTNEKQSVLSVLKTTCKDKMDTVSCSTTFLLQQYEKAGVPHLANRIAYATQILNYKATTPCSAGMGTTTTTTTLPTTTPTTPTPNPGPPKCVGVTCPEGNVRLDIYFFGDGDGTVTVTPPGRTYNSSVVGTFHVAVGATFVVVLRPQPAAGAYFDGFQSGGYCGSVPVTGYYVSYRCKVVATSTPQADEVAYPTITVGLDFDTCPPAGSYEDGQGGISQGADVCSGVSVLGVPTTPSQGGATTGGVVG